jgi:RNA polymerase sigma-70 factor, ECF subfamily
MAQGETQATTIEPLLEDALIRRVEAGDEAAFRNLYERYFPRIFRFVQRRIDNRADVEETVQEVFINIFSSIASYRREAPFEAWVLGLTRRTIARRFKRKRHPTVPLPSEDNEIAEPATPTIQREATPLEHYECRERLAAIRVRAERDLSDEQRELFERHHLHDEPVRELAVLLRKSEDSIKSNLYRARKLLFAS